MSTLEAVLFDFDNTIVNTNHLKPFRERNDFAAITDEDLSKTKPYLPVVHILKKLKDRNIRIGVVTNSPSTYVRRLLDHHEITHLIDVVVTYNDVLHVGKKPSPVGIKIALERLGIEPSRAAYVGDEYTDVVAAYRAHVMPIVPTWASRESVSTPPAAELNSAGVIELVDNVEEKLLFGERCALHKSTDFERKEARFLALDDDSNIVTIRQKMKIFCLGRYFSQKGATTALLHDTHSLSLEIAQKDHVVGYKPPLWMADMLLKIAKSAGEFIFDGKRNIDLVTIVPHKPGKAPRLEYILDQMKALAKAAGLPIEFVADILFFDDAASESLRGMSASERRLEQGGHLHVRSIDLRGRSVLVIDDVITSGATIGRSIELLESLGADSVHGLGIAKTVSIFEETKPCPQCQRDMIIQKNKATGERFWSCSGWFDNKACTHSEPLVVHFCPKCQKPLQLKRNRKDGSLFYGCTGYRDSPSCSYTRSVK